MADCSYARCIQRKKIIRRDLQRWTKNMVHIVGLERIAEELMGRRKWKLYQESMSRTYLQPLNNNVKSLITANPLDSYHQHQVNNNHYATITNHFYPKSVSAEENPILVTPHRQIESETPPPERDGSNIKFWTHIKKSPSPVATNQNIDDKVDSQEQLTATKQCSELEEDSVKDWKPETKCYFCVDGKLDSEHCAHGVLSPRNSDSESTDSPISDGDGPRSLPPSPNPQIEPQRTNCETPSIVANMTAIENVTSMAALAAVAALSNSAANGGCGGGGSVIGTPPPHLPFYAPSMLSQNWYLANMARTFQEQQRLGSADMAPVVSERQFEQPLDLSKGSANIINDRTANHARIPPIDTKHIFNSDFRAKPRMSAVAGRRTYTEDELQAALRDIQSGKLGTRRAAVIYGIPRSTLRNKVYKLALERERESHINTALKLDEEETMDELDKELSGAEEEKEVEKALQAPLFCMDDLFRFSSIDALPESLKAVLMYSKENHLNLDQSDIPPYIQGLLMASQNLLSTGNKLPELTSDFIKRLILDHHHFLNNRNYIIGNRMESQTDDGEKCRKSPPNSITSRTDKMSGKSESDMDTDESPSNVILKIPSFKPTSSKNGCEPFSKMSTDGMPNNNMMSSTVMSDSESPPISQSSKSLSIKDVKDVIAQSITQKFQQSLEPMRRTSMIEMDFRRTGLTPPLSNAGVSTMKSQHDLTRSYQSSQHKSLSSTSSASSSTGGKGTRPKRGKYRNYDRDSLVEAVRAVQRGEMSVHRAGSYYGVPHSTLEYKVKERHLMRPRKRDPKPNPVDEKIASLKQNDQRVAQQQQQQQQQQQEKLKSSQMPAMKSSSQKFSTNPTNGIKLPLFEAGIAPPLAPFPFWPHPNFHHIPLEYARNSTTPFTTPNSEYFPSQMLHNNVHEELSHSLHSGSNPVVATVLPKPNLTPTPTLAKSARQIAESLLDGSGSNGSFLDGIIRSSLESGVPISDEEKLAREDKNVAPENMSNKALLDQLCRNSRLTPLPKPSSNVLDSTPSPDEFYNKTPNSPTNLSSTSNTEEKQQNSTVHSPQSMFYENSHQLAAVDFAKDSNDSIMKRELSEQNSPSQVPRIFLKKDLTAEKPSESMMRCTSKADVNGIDMIIGSASHSGVSQD